MSALTCHLLFAASVVLALLGANAIFYRLRFGTFVPRGRRPMLRRTISRAELVLGTLMVIGLLAGLAVPRLAPFSSFAQWLSEPYSQLAYGVWCVIASIIVNIVFSLRAIFLARQPPLP